MTTLRHRKIRRSRRGWRRASAANPPARAGDVSSPPTLRHGIAAILTGNLIYTASQFVMVVGIARFTDTVEVGRYALATAIASPVFIFAGLKLRHVLAVDASALNKPGLFFGLRIITSILGIGVVATVIAVGGFSTPTSLVILCVSAFKATEAQVDVHYGVLQRREQMGAIARSQTARGIVGLAIFLGVLWKTGSVPIAILMLACFTLVPLATSAVAIRRLGVSPRPIFAPIALARLAWLALPLGISVAIGSLIANVPRYQLQQFEGVSKLGVFAVLAYVLVVTSTIATAMSDGTAPRMANQFLAGDTAGFLRLLRRLMLAGGTLGICGIAGALVLAKPLLRVLFGAEYAAEWPVIVVLMIGATGQYAALSLGTAVNAMRLFRIQVPINLIELCVVAVSAAVLIPRWGLMGAATAIAVAQGAQASMYACVYFVRVKPALKRVAARAPRT